MAALLSGLLAYAICRKVRPLAVSAALTPVLLGMAAGLRPTRPAFLFFLVALTFYVILLTTQVLKR